MLSAEETEDVIGAFLAGKADGVCPKCGKFAEAYDSDEGPGRDHWLERYYTCECGCEFTERFMCKPVYLKVNVAKDKEWWDEFRKATAEVPSDDC